MTDYANFRQRLDAVLRTRDVRRVTDFMLAEDQWSPGAPADPLFAMWMMIAGTPTLAELHEQARAWLVEHGHEAEASALLARQNKQGGQGKQGQRGQRGGPRKQTNRQRNRH